MIPAGSGDEVVAGRTGVYQHGLAQAGGGSGGATTPDVSESTLLAVDRTRLAHERTLMAWIRTATSMISFGFTIYKFLEAQPGRERRFSIVEQLLNARNFGMLMITVGLVGLSAAAFQHHREMEALRVRYGEMPRSNAVMVATLVAVFGIFALLAVVVGP